MNIILLIIIFIILLYVTNKNTFKINKKSIEHITNNKNQNFNNANKIIISNEEVILPSEKVILPSEKVILPSEQIVIPSEIVILPNQLNYNNNTFKLIGTALNKYYNQKYHLYESKNDQYGDLLMGDNLDYLNEQNIYSYKFIIFINNKPNIEQEFGPRAKINIGDIIYLDNKYKSKGISYIGPYIIL
jgi:hypothetical protein